jgi:hypothetical protein
MPFFDPPPPPPPMPDFPPEPRTGRYVPGVVPLELVLAQNDRAAVVLRALFVYPDGVEFQIDTYGRRREDFDPFDFPHFGGFGTTSGVLGLGVHAASASDEDDDVEVVDEEPAPAARRLVGFPHRGFAMFGEINFGVQFPDGVKVTTQRPYVPDLDMMHPPHEAPTHGLTGGGGGGSDMHYEHSYFLWPLPGPGTLTMVCEWSQYGIGETAHDLDTAVILDAAKRARLLWEDEAGLPSHHDFAASMMAMHHLGETFGRGDEPSD